jgi:hypothetical protein
MGFFVFDNAGALSVSRVVWMYPAIVIPLTITVFATWLAWIKLRPNNMEEFKKALDEKLKQNQHETAEPGQP